MRVVTAWNRAVEHELFGATQETTGLCELVEGWLFSNAHQDQRSVDKSALVGAELVVGRRTIGVGCHWHRIVGVRRLTPSLSWLIAQNVDSDSRSILRAADSQGLGFLTRSLKYVSPSSTLNSIHIGR